MGKGRRKVRRLTRREFLLASAGAGAGLVLVGCGGGGGGQGGSGGGEEYSGPSVELAFWNGFTGGDGPYMNALVDQINAEHDNIQVSTNTVEWEDYYQTVPVAVRSEEGPDVGIMHVDQLGTNAARGVIIPLDEVADALGLEESDFDPTVWNAGIYDGQRFGIPLDIHPLALYYNKGLMEEAGLDPNRPPQTRDEYESALEELRGNGIQGSWVSPFPFTGTMQFESLLWQFGGELYNEGATRATFNSDAGVEALTWMVDLVENGDSPSDVAQDAEFIAFQNGENALHWNGIWQINALKEVEDLDWGVAPLPRIGSDDATFANSHNFVITQQATTDQNKVEASQVFINWISQQSIEWARAGQIPARNSVRESQEFEDLPEQATIAQEVPYVHFRPPVPGIGDIQPETYDQAVNEAVLRQSDPQTALDEAAERADQLLEENRQKYET
ncbi:MAG: ABC transporter substrate-binding protein [Actinomycetota bacterium]|nr:ABC transporter substrate-binding protein [Actinomycetota bacterium]